MMWLLMLVLLSGCEPTEPPEDTWDFSNNDYTSDLTIKNEFIWFKIDPMVDLAENPSLVDLLVKAKLDEPPVVLYIQDLLPKVPELERARAVLDILNKSGNYKILEIGANGKPVFILR